MLAAGCSLLAGRAVLTPSARVALSAQLTRASMFSSNQRPQRNKRPPPKWPADEDAPSTSPPPKANPPAAAKGKKTKLTGALAVEAGPSPAALETQPGANADDSSDLTDLEPSDSDTPAQQTSSPAASAEMTAKGGGKKKAGSAKPVKAAAKGSRASKRTRGESADGAELGAAPPADEPAPAPAQVEAEVNEQPVIKKQKKTKSRVIHSPTPEAEPMAVDPPGKSDALAAELIKDDHAPVPTIPEPQSQTAESALLKVLTPTPARAPSPAQPAPAPAPSAVAKKTGEKLNPTAEPFEPSPPSAAAAAAATKPSPSATPAPAAAPKASIFAAKSGGTPVPRKKPGQAGASSSIFASKAGGPARTTTGQSPAPQAKGVSAQREDKGADLFASLVAGTKKVDSAAAAKDAQADKIAKMRVAKKPQMTAEERLADAARRRVAEREAREAARSSRFDLLEQAIRMNSFEEKYRIEVRQMAKDIVDAEGVRWPLPRLTTYGSVYSLYPRSANARQEQDREQQGQQPAGQAA